GADPNRPRDARTGIVQVLEGVLPPVVLARRDGHAIIGPREDRKGRRWIVDVVGHEPTEAATGLRLDFKRVDVPHLRLTLAIEAIEGVVRKVRIDAANPLDLFRLR